MTEILQGTTPTLKINISTSDFLVSDVTKLELCIYHNNVKSIYGLSDVTTDTESNAFTYAFTEAETLAMNPKLPLYYQLRFMFEDGSIVGTNQQSISVAVLRSKEIMTE